MRFESVALGEVCDITMGQAPKGDTYNDDGVGWPLIAGAGDFGELHPAIHKFTTATDVRLCEPGDLVLGIRASIGDKVLANAVYCLGRGVAGLRPRSVLHDRYLWHWISYASHELAQRGRGATFKQVNKSDVTGWRIPLPPIKEQRRIAAVLDTADALRAKHCQLLAKLDALTRAIFLEMFGDPSSSGNGAARIPIGSVADVITGNTPSRSEPAYFGEHIEWLKTDNIRESGEIERAAESLSKSGRAKGREASAGASLVVCIAGSPRSIGRVGYLDRTAAFNQQINAVVPGPDLRAEFLFHQLRAAQRLVQRVSTNSMKGMVSKSALVAMEILVPPLRDQGEFVEMIERVRQVRELASSSLTITDTLLGSLQQRAFRGEL